MDADLAEKLHRRIRSIEPMESSSISETAITDVLDPTLLASLTNYDYSRSTSSSAPTEFSRPQMQSLMAIFDQ